MFGFHIINDEEKRRLNNLKLFRDININFDIIKNAGPEYIKEMMRCVQKVENDAIRKSTKIRTIEGLAYFDGACDFSDKIKYELSQVLSKIIINPNLTDPITGLKYKNLKKEKK